MNGRGWKWRYNAVRKAAPSRSSFDQGAPEENLPAECARHTPLLTALFDGEASEAEIQQARRHLLGCQRCAQTWLGWSQTRVLLLDQGVPKAPPTLVGRIRLACGLTGKTATPDLHDQILARTSRQGSSRPARSKSRLSWPTLPSAPVWGATALGALVLLLAHDSLFSTASLAPGTSPSPASQEAPAIRPLSVSVTNNRNTANRDEQLAILPMESRASKTSSVTATSPARPRSDDTSTTSDATRILLEARRERQSLAFPARRFAPLPVLASLPFEATPLSFRGSDAPKAASRSLTRASSRARRALQEMSSTPAPRVLASRPLVLASAPASVASSEADLTPSAPVPAPMAGEHRSRFLLASAPLERTSLRISAPRVRPITVGQNSVPEDAGLEDLDLTVQQYRSSLSDDSSNASGDAG